MTRLNGYLVKDITEETKLLFKYVCGKKKKIMKSNAVEITKTIVSSTPLSLIVEDKVLGQTDLESKGYIDKDYHRGGGSTFQVVRPFNEKLEVVRPYSN